MASMEKDDKEYVLIELFFFGGAWGGFLKC